MIHPRYVRGALTVVLALGLTSMGARGAQRDGDRKPSLSLRATPPAGFAPLRVRFSADIRGGADDTEELYCPAVSWEWGDGTVSETSEDCAPYQAGTSTIRRQFSTTHTFRQSGAFQVRLRLKQHDKVVAGASANVQVRGGLADDFGD